jgi:hypothetical protein
MRRSGLVRFLLAAAAIAAAPTTVAQAAVITPSNSFSPPATAWRYAIVMGSEVSTLTLEGVPGNAARFRVRESGASLGWVTPNPSAQGPDPCFSEPGGVVNCAAGPFGGVQITNSGGSSVPPTRDQVIVRGSAHGDAQDTWMPTSVSVTSTGGLMEFWGGDYGGVFTGSDIAVGTPAAPADIWHAGPDVFCIVTCELRGGADRFEGGSGSEGVTGGAGDDVLIGGPGNDTLTGGLGNDQIFPGSGKDALSGGDGTDTLSFDDPRRTTGLTATFASGAAGTVGQVPFDDSEQQMVTGTGDAYDATFERYEGTAQSDRLTGGAGPDWISGAGSGDVIDGAAGSDSLLGGSGSDTLTGGPGLDTFFGGDGDDTIAASDGLAETVDCGAGYATLDVDPIDVLTNCVAPPTPTPVPTSAPTPTPAVSAPPPSATPGPAPLIVVPPLPAVAAKVALKTRSLKSGRTLLQSLRVEGLRAGDMVELRCAGTGCKKRASPKATTVKGKKTSISYTSAISGLQLKVGASVIVKVTRAGFRGQVVTYTAVARKAPKRATLCVAPGAASTQAC